MHLKGKDWRRFRGKKPAPKVPEWPRYGNFCKVTQNHAFSKKVQMGNQRKFFKNRPKSRPRFKRCFKTVSSNTLLPPHWRHLLYHFLKPVERETETTIKTKSKYSLCTTSDRSVAGRGINKAVDLVTMLRFVLSLFLLWRTEFGLKLNGYIDDSLTRCFGYYWRSRIGYWVFAHTKPAIQWFAWVTSKQKIPHAQFPMPKATSIE